MEFQVLAAGINMSPNNPFFAPLENPEVQNHFKNYGIGAYSSNPELKRLGSTLGNFVSRQPISFTDETGTINIDPINQGFSVQPRQGFGLAIKGRDMRFGTPSAEVTFQFGKDNQNSDTVGIPETITIDTPETIQAPKSAARAYLDNFIDERKIKEAREHYYY
jgi:hypothetical protein